MGRNGQEATRRVAASLSEQHFTWRSSQVNLFRIPRIVQVYVIKGRSTISRFPYHALQARCTSCPASILYKILDRFTLALSGGRGVTQVG